MALLGAMYGQTGGAAVPALAVLRRSYPTAFAYVEAAARTGEAGGLVRSWLGRTCPPGSVGVADGDEAGPTRTARPTRTAPGRGRPARGAGSPATSSSRPPPPSGRSTLLATLRTELAGTGAELVFFQHDEVVVHCPAGQADAVVAEAVRGRGERARRLLFGDTPVRFPLDVSIVDCYADAA